MPHLEKSSQNVKHGQHYSAAETALLRRLYAESRTVEEIAEELQRTPRAVRRKLWERGLNPDRPQPKTGGGENPALRSLRAICRLYACQRDHLLAHSGRYRPWPFRRALAAWLARQLGVTYPVIGKHLQRNHSTIMHAVELVDKKRASSPACVDLTDRLLAYLRGDGEWPADLEDRAPLAVPDPPPAIVEEPRPAAVVSEEVETPFYTDPRRRRSFLVEQNDRFCEAMRAAMALEMGAGK